MAEFQPQHVPAGAALELHPTHRAFLEARARESGGKYGAAMGWSNTPGESLPLRSAPVNRSSSRRCNVTLRPVPLPEGYDSAGFYYGLPSDLWEAFADAPGGQPFRFRAPNRRAAREVVLQHYPRARFAAALEGLDDMLRGYLACAEWLMRDELDVEGTGRVREGIARGWTRESLKRAESDCAEFLADNAVDLEAYQTTTGRDMESAGHDFFLTRNGHGAGFWDRGDAPCLDRLSAAARAAGECDAELSRNGWMRLD